MGHVSWLKDLNGKLHLSEPPAYKPLERRHREVLIEREVFESINAYENTTPTGPSAGRIYVRHKAAPTPGNPYAVDMEEGWLFIVINEPPGTAPVCSRCKGSRRIRYLGSVKPRDCVRCDGTGVAKPGQLHVPYKAVFV